MRRLLLALLLLAATGPEAQAQKPLEDPEAFAASIMRDYTNRIPEIAGMITEALGRSEMGDEFKREFERLAGARVSVTDKVYDVTYGSSLRQIVYYTSLDRVAFVYLRFNFKRIGKGWVLVNFLFRDELSELFPEGFGPRSR